MRGRAARLAAGLLALALAGCSDEAPPPDGGGAGESGDLVQVPGAFVDPNSAGLSPDGSQIAVPCDGLICVWDTADGALADTWDGGSIVAWSPSGDVVATERLDGESVGLLLLDATTGAEVAHTEAYETEVVQDAPGDGFLELAFSPDGKTVAGVGSDGVVRLWSVADPGDPAVIAAASERAIDVAFSPDGSQVAVASVEAPVTIHDVDSGEVLGSLGADPQRGVDWSADGTVLATTSLAVGDDAATTIWDAESLTAEATLPRAGDELAVAPSSDTLALSELGEPTVLVWDWATDDLAELAGAKDNPRAVLWAPDGSLVYAVSAQDGVLAWDPNAGGAPSRFAKPEE